MEDAVKLPEMRRPNLAGRGMPPGRETRSGSLRAKRTVLSFPGATGCEVLRTRAACHRPNLPLVELEFEKDVKNRGNELKHLFKTKGLAFSEALKRTQNELSLSAKMCAITAKAAYSAASQLIPDNYVRSKGWRISRDAFCRDVCAYSRARSNGAHTCRQNTSARMRHPCKLTEITPSTLRHPGELNLSAKCAP